MKLSHGYVTFLGKDDAVFFSCVEKIINICSWKSIVEKVHASFDNFVGFKLELHI